MRSWCLPCLLCCSSVLLAHPAPPLAEPGRNDAFLARVLEPTAEGPARPWHTFRVPPEEASAVVEVVGELTAEELRQVKFEAFLTWFREDLRAFWLKRGGGEVTNPLPAAQAAGPGPRLATLARVGF